MQRRELFAILAVFLVLVGLPATALGYQYWLRPEISSTRVIDVDMTIPEDSSFQPDFIEIAVGEPVTLRFSSLDVTHGIAIGPGLDIDLGHVDPGKVAEVTVTFDESGVYTYYCNTWCSPNHWRMRGTIQVIDPDNPAALPAPITDPAIEALITEGIDIDLAHSTDNIFPLTQTPSITWGEALIDTLEIPAEVVDPVWQRSHPPTQALEQLQARNPSVAQADLVDVVAYLWQPPSAPIAESLYNKNCAACHGQYGAADGPAAADTVEDPIVFADPGYMFNVRSDVLYAKIRRGGMGTDMPNFGTLLTQAETWALVDYLWTFPFEVSGN